MTVIVRSQWDSNFKITYFRQWVFPKLSATDPLVTLPFSHARTNDIVNSNTGKVFLYSNIFSVPIHTTMLFFTPLLS